MSKPLFRLNTVALIALVVLIGMCASGLRPAVADGLRGEDLPWMDDLEAGKTKARAEGRLLAVFVWRPKVRNDKKYESDTLAHKDVAPLWAESFVLVRLDADSAAGKAFLQRHSGAKLPVLWFFTSDFRPVKQIVGVVRRSIIEEQIKEVVGRFAGNDAPSTGTQGPAGEADETEGEAVKQHEYPGTSPWVCSTTQPVIDKALKWLAGEQSSRGSFSRERVHDDPKRHSSLDYISTALTATAGLAFLASGSTAADGPYKSQIQKCASWLRSHQRRDGIISDESDDDIVHQTYSYWQHALAILFLAEVLHRDKENADLRKDLEKACAALSTEQKGDGGWGYGLGYQERDPGGEWGWTALGPVALLVAGVGHAKAAGCEVDDAIIEKGLQYVVACQQPDGGVRYRKDDKMCPSYPQATAMGLLGMGLCGRSDTAPAQRMGQFLRTSAPYFGRAGLGKYRYLGRLAIALAMARQGCTPTYEGVGTGAEDWHITFRDVALTGQQEDGSWKDVEGKGGRVWSTSCNLLALMVQQAGSNLVLASPEARPVAPSSSRVSYEDRPDERCRWKVFEVRESRLPALRYGVDLRIGIEQPGTPLPASYAENVLGAFQHVADLLYDCTDGQVYLRKVTYDPADGHADECDMRFTKREFPGVDGMARTVRVIKNGRDVGAFGEWIECPWQLGMRANYPLAEGGGWNTAYGRRVLAHELGHYLFALPDRYNQSNGRPRDTATLMGGAHTRASEFSRPGYHADTVLPETDWAMMKSCFSRLSASKHPDMGPYRAPLVEIDVVGR